MRLALLAATAVALAGCTSLPGPATDLAARGAEVAAVERAFARTMADRDHAGFTRFIADEAVFVAGPKTLRGRDAVAAAWKPFFVAATAPFSWTPDRVEVLASGTLAYSSGPVLDPSGKLVGRFTSIWRLEAPGTWRIVFDSGADACD